MATPQPRFRYDPLNRFLGVKAGDRTLTIAGEPSTTGEDYANAQGPKPENGIQKYLGIPQGENLPAHLEEVRQEEGGPPSGGGGAELSPTQRGPVNAPELAPTKLTPHDLRPAIIVNGQPVTATSALVHRDIVDDAVKSNSPQAPDIVLAAGDDKNHVFVDPNNNVLTRDQASTALGLKQPLHSEGLNRLKGPSPDWPGRRPLRGPQGARTAAPCPSRAASPSARRPRGCPASIAVTSLPGRMAAIICCTRCLRVASAWNRTRHSPASTPVTSARQSSCALPSAASVASTLWLAHALGRPAGRAGARASASPSLTCSASAPRSIAGSSSSPVYSAVPSR